VLSSALSLGRCYYSSYVGTLSVIATDAATDRVVVVVIIVIAIVTVTVAPIVRKDAAIVAIQLGGHAEIVVMPAAAAVVTVAIVTVVVVAAVIVTDATAADATATVAIANRYAALCFAIIGAPPLTHFPFIVHAQQCAVD